jgi:hypothetical protein
MLFLADMAAKPGTINAIFKADVCNFYVAKPRGGYGFHYFFKFLKIGFVAKMNRLNSLDLIRISTSAWR